MIAVKPADINRARLVTTNAVDEPLFDMATTYANGAVARVGDEAFRSIAPDNLGHDPLSSPLWWESAGPCNQMAMFDNSPTTMTVGPVDASGNPQPLRVGLRPGSRISDIALLRVKGARAEVFIYVAPGGPLLRQETANLVTSFGTYYGWCFEPLRQTPDVVFSNLAVAANPYIEIVVHAAGGQPAQIGLAVTGRRTPVGRAEYGFTQGVEMRGRSYIDRNGNPVRLDRGFRKTISGTLVVNNKGGIGFPMEVEVSYDRVANFLGENVGIPLLWILDEGMQDHRSAVLFGDYERTVMTIDNHVSSKLSIDINGYF